MGRGVEEIWVESLTGVKLAVGKNIPDCGMSQGKGQEVWEEWNQQGESSREEGRSHGQVPAGPYRTR